MSTIIQRLKLLSLFTLAIFIFQSCAKDEPVIEPVVTETDFAKPFELHLTDCPFDADQVNVFTDGVDTLLAYGDISIDNIANIYMELGTQNTIVVDGTSYPLQLQGSYTVEIPANLGQIEHLAFLVDFFACTSIVNEAGEYFLNPIIEFKGELDNSQEVAVDLIETFEECYQIVYPILLLDNNNTTLVASSRTALIDILINNEIEDVIFPVNLLDPFGEPITLNSEADVDLLLDCDLIVVEEGEVLSEFESLLNQLTQCYEIVFPLSLLNKENQSIEVQNALELLQIFENNEIENAVYPIQLIDSNGDTININSALDFTMLNLDC